MGVPAILSEVPNVTPYIQYIATLGQTAFDYPFPITQDSDLIVVVNGVTLGTDSGYSLSGQGNDTGGTLTFTSGRAANDIVTLYRDVAIERITQIGQNSGFSSTTFNAEFNQIYLIMQQLEASIALCLQIPNTNSPAPVTTLSPSLYANKYQAYDSNGNPTPAALTSSGTVTQALILSFLTQAVLAGLLQPQTTAESAAGVTPANLQYAPGVVDRYLTNAHPGSTDMTTAFQASINQARKGGADVVWGSSAPYMLTAVLDCTFTGSGQQSGITFRQIGTPGTNLPTNTEGGLYINHGHSTVFDLTGCNSFAFYDLTAITNNGGTYPSTMFLTARNSTGESNFPRFYNTKVSGFFSVSILYNYGSEDGMYVGNVWENYATDAGACAVVITANNLYKGSAAFMSSGFATIATGAQSCIGHRFFGGDYAVVQASATSDTFYLEGAVTAMTFTDGWVECSNSGGVTHGRSYLYNDVTNGAAVNTKWEGVWGENSATLPTYGWDLANGTGTAIGWKLSNCRFGTNSNAVNSASTVTLATWNIDNLTEIATKGINVSGTIETSVIDYVGTINVGTSISNVWLGAKNNITITTRTNDFIFDRATGAILAAGSIGLFGNAAVTQSTGWGTPTSPSVQANYSGSAATLVQTSAAVAEIITILKSVGILAT